MFENLIGQQRVTGRLRREIEMNHLPSGLLFAGNDCSGKLTAALELSRSLMCRQSGAWNCGCSECREHRTLSHPMTLLLGKRDFLPEIQAALSYASRSGEEGLVPRLMVIRSVNKLTSRFNPAVSGSMEKPLKKASSALDSVRELLSPLYPGGPEKGWYSKKWADNLIKHCTKIEDALPDGVSVNEIRAVNHWAHTSGHSARTVIIESAERLNASAANALLKTLEEPPEGLTFILLTRRRGAILPTILSRVRLYDFAQREQHVQHDVIRRVFREEDPYLYSGVQDYLYDIAGVGVDRFERFANALLVSLTGGDSFLTDDYEPIYNAITEKVHFKVFLEQLIKVIRQAGCEGSVLSAPVPVARSARWNSLIRETWQMNASFNQSSRSLLESLFLRMKTVDELPAQRLAGL